MIRRARADEFVALYELEKAASLAALAHVFPVQTCPFPDADVQARYRVWFEDPSFRTLVDERDGRLTALVAYDNTQLRQLSVLPEFWGTGLAVSIMRACLDDLVVQGSDEVSLWVLADNQRARRFYERSGWRRTDQTSTSQFPPHPTMVGYRRVLRGRAPR